jgi:hypothetical protein
MKENIMYLKGDAKVICKQASGECPRSKRHWRSMGIARCNNCRYSALVILGEIRQPYVRYQYEGWLKIQTVKLLPTVANGEMKK